MLKLTLRMMVVILLITQCKPKQETKETSDAMPTKPELKISLAQWSLHRAFFDKTLKPEDFAAIAKNEFGITAIEYVNQFYRDQGSDEAFWKKMRAKADSLGVKSLLIMVDGEGPLGHKDPAERKKAVENHKKWVDAAAILGCHSIRVNAIGEGTKEELQTNMVDGLTQLCTYAKQKNINVIIENHGRNSSNGEWLATLIKRVNMDNCGTLPDFGNWCMDEQWGGIENCKNRYDMYKGTEELMPFAKGVSAKSNTFNEQGEETMMDYTRLLQIVKDAGYTGYIGIEYEGSALPEPAGILATKTLLEKSWAKVQ